MRILGGHVFWWEGAASDPCLRLLVDRIPRPEELRYERLGELYYAELDGFVDFKAYERPGDGYGGHTFEITMTDGSHKSLVGPWSSSSQALNAAGFGPCVEASLTDDPASYRRGHTFIGGAVTVALVEEHAGIIEVGDGYCSLLGSGSVGGPVAFGDSAKLEMVGLADYPWRPSVRLSGEQAMAVSGGRSTVEAQGTTKPTYWVPGVRLADGTVWRKR